ncbi:MAG: hypothetical protein ACE5I5_05255 [Candidatus Heimdallarchaeota archaeon]
MVAKKVLVVGLLKVDSGKTTFSRCLITTLKERGLGIVPFKPLSGHNFYYQWAMTLKNVRKKRLFCHDIDKLAAAAQIQLPIELLNPVDRLLVPLDFEKYLRFPRRFFNHAEKIDALLLQRISFVRNCRSLQLENVYLSNKSATSRVLWDPQGIKEILKGADKVLEMEGLHQLVIYHTQHFEEATTAALKALEDQAKWILIESLNDIACPAPCAASADIVVAIVPGLALCYSPKDFFRTLNLQRQLKGKQRPIFMKELCPVIDPLWKIRLNFRTQTDKVGPEFEQISDYIVSSC